MARKQAVAARRSTRPPRTNTRPKNGKRKAVDAPDETIGLSYDAALAALPPVHPALAIVPMMTETAVKAGAVEMRDRVRSGRRPLVHKIVMAGDEVLDGRARWIMCAMAGIDPRLHCEQWDRTGSAAGYVLTSICRSHLTAGQRAMIAVEMADILKAEARERQRGGRGGTLLQTNLSEADKGPWQAQAGKRVGVSGSSVKLAANVVKAGCAKMVEGVKAGMIPLKLAADAVEHLTVPQQKEALANGKAGVAVLLKIVKSRSGAKQGRREKRGNRRTRGTQAGADASADTDTDTADTDNDNDKDTGANRNPEAVYQAMTARWAEDRRALRDLGDQPASKKAHRALVQEYAALGAAIEARERAVT